MDPRNAAYMAKTELGPLAFLPVLFFYSVCRSAFPPNRISKIQLLRVLEAHASPEKDVPFFMTDHLKSNLHRLFEVHFGDVDSPDFDHLEHDLVESCDLLLLKCSEQAAFRPYRKFMRRFATQVAMHPMCDSEVSDEAYRKMRLQAQTLCRMIG